MKRGILAMLFCMVTNYLFAQVQLKIELDKDGVTYKIFMNSSKSLSGNQSIIVTSQISLIVPHGVGSNRFIPENIVSPHPNMRWIMTNRVDAPQENPDGDYLFFSFFNNQIPLVNFNISANQDLLLFSFKRKGNCTGKVNIVEPELDAFWPPNSQNVNVGTSIAISGLGVNAYKGNQSKDPIISLKTDNENLCAGKRVILKADLSIPTQNAKYQWFIDNVEQKNALSDEFSYQIPKGDADKIIKISVKLRVDGTDQCNQYSTKAMRSIEVRGIPDANLTSDIEKCVVLPAKLEVINQPLVDFEWSKDGSPISNEKSSKITIKENGKYQLKASKNGCVDVSKEIEIVGVSSFDKIKLDAGKDTTILGGEKLILEGTSIGGESFEWSPSSLVLQKNTIKTAVFPIETTKFTLTAKDKNGCPTTDEVLVNVIPKLYIPNSFTPNNDNLNDDWELFNIENYPETKLEIFNRWGKLIFEKSGYEKKWDGKIDGILVENDAYNYVIKTRLKTYRGILNVIY